MWYLEKLRHNLTESETRRLKAIREPTVVAVQPDDSRRGLCVMPDGELRYYGVEGKTHCWAADGRSVYLASRSGLDWTRHEGPEGSAPVLSTGAVQTGFAAMGAAARIPWSGRYVTVVTWPSGERKGTWAELSDEGPGDTAPRLVRICGEVCGVNLSVGYYDEHKPEERVCLAEWQHTLDVVRGMLAKPLARFPLAKQEN